MDKQVTLMKTAEKNKLITCFKSCLDILRDSECITGNKALRNISYLLTLKLIEPKIGKEIDIDGFAYDFEHIHEDMINNHKTKLLSICRFTNLALEKDDNISENIKYLWNDVLSKNPATRNVFLTGKGFDIQYHATYKKLIQKLNSIDLLKTECDILGSAYEEVIQDIMTGKMLGQFFTQPLLKNMMVDLINPQIHKDGSIESCCDPTMGTGGFLITYIKRLMNQAKEKNIEMNWDFVKSQGIYGKEIDNETFQLAVSNMLISTGHVFDALENGDSIREPINRKFDNILANPPFGIKGFDYDAFTNANNYAYTPIKSGNAVSLFLQAIIHMLNINGKCAIVLPDGQDLFSKSSVFVNIRKYLMKTCSLQEVIYFPSGMFDYTSIKTCIFYFIKKISGEQALVVKRNKTTAYSFCKEHQTTSVKFYEYNLIANVKSLLVEVEIADLEANKYALNYTDYIKPEKTLYNSEITEKTLGEICEFLPKSKRAAAYGTSSGAYPFFTSSQKCNKFCNEADYKLESLIIGTGGSANIKYSSGFSCSADNIIVVIKPDHVAKFVYYYLLNNIEILQKGFVGSALKHVSKDYIKGILIPIPSVEIQKAAVEYLDFIHEKNVNLYQEIQENNNKSKSFFLDF